MADQQSAPVSKTAYHMLFQQSDDAILIADEQAIIQQANPVASHQFQAQVGQSLTALIQDYFDIDFSLQGTYPFPLEQKKGQTDYYTLQIIPVPADKQYLITLKDVSELTRLQKEFSHFAHTLSHDVKSPLGVAVGYANILQSEVEDGTETRFFVDEIFDTGIRIMNICNELVLLADIQHLQQVDMMSTDIKQILETAMRRFNYELSSREVTLQIPDDPVHVVANPPWVEEVIVDYLRYALTQQTITQLTIAISRTDAGDVCFALSHNGEPPSSEKLFTNTINIKKIRAEGFGLGLDVARRLIELMEGQIAITPDGALTFSLAESR